MPMGAVHKVVGRLEDISIQAKHSTRSLEWVDKSEYFCVIMDPTLLKAHVI